MGIPRAGYPPRPLPSHFPIEGLTKKAKVARKVKNQQESSIMWCKFFRHLEQHQESSHRMTSWSLSNKYFCISRDVIISSQICGSKLKSFFFSHEVTVAGGPEKLSSQAPLENVGDNFQTSLNPAKTYNHAFNSLWWAVLGCQMSRSQDGVRAIIACKCGFS